GPLRAGAPPPDADDYAHALGATPGLYGASIAYPLDAGGTAALDDVVHAAAAQGARAFVQLEPTRPLAKLSAGDARDLADELARLHRTEHASVAVDLAPEMNGSWVAWGQQPQAFVAAFRTLAATLHAHAPGATTVWQPVVGAGYPFTGARGSVQPSGPRDDAALDTNHDGRIDDADDPYGPYWPGGAAVDEVGLSAFWYGDPDHPGRSAVPPAGWFTGMLHGAVGYDHASGSGCDFVARFATAEHKPMLVVTGALWTPGTEAPSREAVVGPWLQQVLSPALSGVGAPGVWFAQSRAEAVARSGVVDWRLADDRALLTALRGDLRAGDFATGAVPVSTAQVQADSAPVQIYEPRAHRGDGQADRVLVGVLVLLALFAVSIAALRLRPGWRYREDAGVAGGQRDRRIDLLRGFAIACVVLTHVEVGGPGTWFVVRLGALSSAELFLLLSGVVLGGVYPRLARKQGEVTAAMTMVRRAGRMYAATLAITVAVYLFSRVPGTDATVLTTFTDRGTGLGGAGAAGRVYYLFGTAQHLLDYPPPGYAVWDLLFLRYGPWPINIMGLFIVLSLAVPAAMWLVRRGLWWALLVVSWALYALNAVYRWSLFDAQFEAVFPLLTWQVAFTHGLVIGYHRDRIVRWFSSRRGLAALGGVLVATAAVLTAIRAGLHVPGLPAWDALYPRVFDRTTLQLGRVYDLLLVLVVAYLVATACWEPLRRTAVRVLEPLGQHSQGVFYLQVFAVLAVSWIPGLSRTDWLAGAAVHVGVLAVIWTLVVGVQRRRQRPPAAAEPAPAPSRTLVST
ncbi:MAG: OpgC domain-containing protein, partial [Jatrophihabitans sp.]|uniref:OpgC domain-containing protein n=1 Tax=Jatrophihabitans sp. TaxID=1932789 RepID=UPI003F7D97CF